MTIVLIKFVQTTALVYRFKLLHRNSHKREFHLGAGRNSK